MSHIAYLEQIHESLKGKKILDLGSGKGKFLFMCREAGYDAVGVELSAEKIKATQAIAREKGVAVSVIQGEAEHISFKEDSFDFINASELIEHVQNPAQVLSEMQRILRPGGTAYVSAHNRFGLYYTHFRIFFFFLVHASCPTRRI
ncbi:class I SAM-dependent methyltransferase [Candidatus Azambacteria bacterium]|nr:class I SAM-dependent methyltransferase [Candidatus Azambacteria bacterium]